MRQDTAIKAFGRDTESGEVVKGETMNEKRRGRVRGNIETRLFSMVT